MGALLHGRHIATPRALHQIAAFASASPIDRPEAMDEWQRMYNSGVIRVVVTAIGGCLVAATPGPLPAPSQRPPSPPPISAPTLTMPLPPDFHTPIAWAL